jgi:hypothetical protein
MAREGAPTPEEAQSDFKDLEELSLGDQRKFMVEDALRARAYEPPAVWVDPVTESTEGPRSGRPSHAFNAERRGVGSA